jgi:O-antigen/teichoic acid export membrane protein
MIKQVATFPYARRAWQVVRQSPLLAVGGINGFTVFVSVVMGLVLVRFLPKEEYGQLVFFYANFGMVRLLMNCGLGMSLSRDIAGTGRDIDRQRTIIYSNLVLSLSATLVVVLGTTAVGLVTHQHNLSYVIVAASIASLADFIFSLITGLRLTKSVGLMTAIQPLTYAVLILFLVVTQMALAIPFMLSYTIAFAMMASVGIALAVRSRQVPGFDGVRVNWQYVRGSLAFAIPAYITTLLSQGWASFSAGLLGGRGDFQAAAEFGVVFNFVSLFISISAPTLVTTFFPQISYLNGRGDKEGINRYVRSTLSMLLYAYLFVAVALIAFPDTAVDVLFGSTYQSSSSYLTIIAPVVVFMGITPVFSLTQSALGRPRRAGLGAGVQLLTLMGLVFLKGDGIDATWLSWSVLISSLVGLLTHMVLFSQTLNAPVLPANLPSLVIIALAAAFILRYLGSMIGVPLSIWHFVLGGLFTASYWFNALRTGGLLWLRSAT